MTPLSGQEHAGPGAKRLPFWLRYVDARARAAYLPHAETCRRSSVHTALLEGFEAPMADIVVCCAVEDRDRVRGLAAALGRRGWRVGLMAFDRGSGPLPMNVASKIDGVQAIVVVWTHTSARRRIVHDVAERARGNGSLVPALLDRIRPKNADLPPMPIDMTSWDGRPDSKGWVRLTASLRALVPEPEVQIDEEDTDARAMAKAQPQVSPRTADRRQAPPPITGRRGQTPSPTPPAHGPTPPPREASRTHDEERTQPLRWPASPPPAPLVRRNPRALPAEPAPLLRPDEPPALSLPQPTARVMAAAPQPQVGGDPSDHGGDSDDTAQMQALLHEPASGLPPEPPVDESEETVAMYGMRLGDANESGELPPGLVAMARRHGVPPGTQAHRRPAAQVSAEDTRRADVAPTWPSMGAEETGEFRPALRRNRPSYDNLPATADDESPTRPLPLDGVLDGPTAVDGTPTYPDLGPPLPVRRTLPPQEVQRPRYTGLIVLVVTVIAVGLAAWAPARNALTGMVQGLADAVHEGDTPSTESEAPSGITRAVLPRQDTPPPEGAVGVPSAADAPAADAPPDLPLTVPSTIEDARRQRLERAAPEVADLVQQGWAAIDAGSLSTAIDRFQQALVLDATSVDAQYGIGYAEFKRGNLDEAQRYMCVAQPRLSGLEQAEVRGILGRRGRSCDGSGAW